MNPKSAAAFSLACLLTGIGWAIFWPQEDKEAALPPPRGTVVELTREKVKTETLIATLDSATSDEDRLQAAMQLAEIPPSEIRSALESIELFTDRRLNLAAKTLLIRWATNDGDAAVRWAWQRFRGKPAWMDAFKEVGPAWAWRDPAGFGKWALARIEARGSHGDVSLDEANADDQPLLEFGNLSQISGWLFKEDPRLAMEIFLKRGGFSTHDDKIWHSFTDPRRIEQTMLAFDQKSLDAMKAFDGTGRYTLGPESHAETLLKNWKEADPEGFAKSPYAEYLPRRNFEATQSAALTWHEAPPAKRADVAHQILSATGEKSRASTAAQIAKAWCANDPDACRQWLETLPGQEVGVAAGEFVQTHAAVQLEETLDWMERFTPEFRTAYLVRAFDAWNAAHPEATAETAGWSDARREAWEDLEALKEAGVP